MLRYHQSLLFLFYTGIAILMTHRCFADGEARTYKFTPDEVKTLKHILSIDKFTIDMVKEESGISALNTVLAKVASGPLTLTINWNEGLLKGWAIANEKLANIGKLEVCNELLEPTLDDSPNAKFFVELSKLRGCDNL